MTTATGRADALLEGVELVVSERPIETDDEAEEVEEAEALEAEDRTLGQKVLLHVCTSVGKHYQSDRRQACLIHCSLSKSPKEHVDFAKHGVTEDLMIARFAAVHWQR